MSQLLCNWVLDLLFHALSSIWSLGFVLASSDCEFGAQSLSLYLLQVVGFAFNT